MSKILRVVVLTTALLTALATASTAGAVTWENSGDTAFTATGAATTLHFDTVHMPCTGSTTTATTGASPSTGATWAAATGTVTYPHCTLSGQTFSLACSYTLTLSGQSGLVSSGALDTECSLSAFGTKVCGYDGTIPATYTNPNGGPGSLTLHHATLAGTNGPVGTCPYKPFTFTEQTWTITSATGGPAPHNGPVFTRTA
jgi:hypothetical protein